VVSYAPRLFLLLEALTVGCLPMAHSSNIQQPAWDSTVVFLLPSLLEKTFGLDYVLDRALGLHGLTSDRLSSHKKFALAFPSPRGSGVDSTDATAVSLQHSHALYTTDIQVMPNGMLFHSSDLCLTKKDSPFIIPCRPFIPYAGINVNT